MYISFTKRAVQYEEVHACCNRQFGQFLYMYVIVVMHFAGVSGCRNTCRLHMCTCYMYVRLKGLVFWSSG